MLASSVDDRCGVHICTVLVATIQLVVSSSFSVVLMTTHWLSAMVSTAKQEGECQLTAAQEETRLNAANGITRSVDCKKEMTQHACWEMKDYTNTGAWDERNHEPPGILAARVQETCSTTRYADMHCKAYLPVSSSNLNRPMAKNLV